MCGTACTEPQCVYKGALYFFITQYTCCSKHAEEDTPSQEVRALPALPLSTIDFCFLDTRRIILEFTFTD
jgi:hypothetical protein